jgi:hypothetical protein
MGRWLFLIAVSGLGCASFESTARSQFVRLASCPDNRVSVTHEAPEAAPQDIAADPPRLAVWNADADRRAKSHYVARGCGQVHRYFCETQYQGETSWRECRLDQ